MTGQPGACVPATDDADLLAGLAPDIAMFLRAVRAADGPKLRDLPPEEARRRFAAARQGAPAGLEMAYVADGVVLAGGRNVPIRTYEPPAMQDRTIVFLHGGGWTVGSVALSDASARALAIAARARVVSVDYALAPERPFPAAFEDVLAVVASVRAHAAGTLILAGESAGANLATAAAAEIAGVSAQILIYPVVDCDLSRASYRDPIAALVLSREDMAQFWQNYVPDAAQRTAARTAPLRHITHAAAPAFIATAEHDVLRDEAEAYAELLGQAGTPVRLRRYPGTVHGFFAVPSRFGAAQALLGDIAAFLDDLPGETGGRD